ncbi:MAG: type II toxin-antitoxin system VapC family toxin [Pseudomonadota bacterium]
MNSVLLDTSFLITFADPNRPFHDTAHKYFRECVARRVRMYLSTIAISEFEVKQRITDLPLRNFIVLPFNIEHAVQCGSLFSTTSRDTGDNRAVFKDDLKLIAQCDAEGITHVLTEDENTLAKYLQRIHSGVFKPTQAVLLSSGFDTSWFEDGQKGLMD